MSSEFEKNTQHFSGMKRSLDWESEILVDDMVCYTTRFVNRKDWFSFMLVSKQFLRCARHAYSAINPALDHKKSLMWACEHKKTECLKALLQDPRIDPDFGTYNSARAIVYSGPALNVDWNIIPPVKGAEDLVETMMSFFNDPEHKCTMTGSQKGAFIRFFIPTSALYLALSLGYTDGVRLLLNVSRVSIRPSEYNVWMTMARVYGCDEKVIEDYYNQLKQ